MATALAMSGFRPRLVATDFCTDHDGFQAHLAAEDPALVVMPYQAEFHEILEHLASLVRSSVEVPVVLVGDTLARRGVPERLPEGLHVLPGFPAGPFQDLLEGRSAQTWDLARLPMDLGAYGGGRLLERPLAASLFGELDTVGLLAARRTHAGICPTASLARLEAPVGGGPVVLDRETALRPLKDLGARPARVEWWDRHAGSHVLACVRALSGEVPSQTVRIVPEHMDAEGLEAFRGAGVDRVVFEVDRFEGAAPGPGTAGSVKDMAPLAHRARSLGMQVGVLLVVGVPGESPGRAAARLEDLRRLAPDHLRCVPFEPTPGTPMERLALELGARPAEEGRWNRELHRPLRTESLDAEGFIADWAEALLYQAEVETRGGGGP